MELVVSHNGLSVVLWSKPFFGDQGYTVKHKMLYPDNKSTILMEKNGRAFISNGIKHIKAI